MREYWVYIRRKSRELMEIGILLLLLGVSSQILLPHVMQQWSHDRTIGALHVLAGIATGVLGTVGVILFTKRQFERTRNKTAWKKNMIHLILWYLAAQLLVGILQGLLGLLLYRIGFLSYDSIKVILYVAITVIQNLIRVWFLYLLIEMYADRSWRTDLLIVKKAEAAAILLSIITLGMAFLPGGVWQNMVRIIWEVIYLTGFMVYFGNAQRRIRE